jgi:hypothetical protein
MVLNLIYYFEKIKKEKIYDVVLKKFEISYNLFASFTISVTIIIKII